ncbi:MAG: hypothetical protein L0207_04700 [Chlamydiae bacterium]|nr:hypothetical protein [Chlamydiota bacterium]
MFFKYLFSLIIFSSLLFAEEIVLKPREPHWQPKIIEIFADGQPKQVVFYEQKGEEKEKPVKKITYHSNGQIENEIDLAIIAEDSPGFREWNSTIVPDGCVVSFFSNGKIEKITRYKEGLLEGEMKLFFPEGEIKMVSHFKNGKPHGSTISYHKDGKKAEEMQYEEDKLVGEFIRYYPETEAKAAAIPYHQGVVHGIAMEWHPNGMLKSSRQFSDGAVHSDGKNPAVMVYDENRNLIEVQDFHLGEPIGTHIKYHSNGKESYRVFYKNGQKQGEEVYYSTEGKIIGKGEYRNGDRIGDHWRNHPNGKPLVIAHYDKKGKLLEPIVEFNEEGQKIGEYTVAIMAGKEDKGKYGYEGKCTEWYPNGNLRQELEFFAGVLEGEQKEYFPSGNLKTRMSFAYGVKAGPFEQWHENGNKAVSCLFSNGKKDGQYLVYFENGKPRLEEYYVEDQLDNLRKEWHENGSLKFEGDFIVGKKQGWHREWNEKGELISEAKYENDLPDGIAKIFYAKDKIRQRNSFSLGKRNGQSEEFYENGKPKYAGKYQDDLLDGEVKGWYENGSLWFVKRFELGKMVAEQKEYFPPESKEEKERGFGKLARFFVYNSTGLLDGEQRSFYTGGKTQTIVQYKDGKLHGMKALWDEEGNIVEEAWYENDRLNGKFFEKAKDGKEIVFHYKDNKKDGLHEIFFPPHPQFGKMKALEIHFQNDLPEGDVIEYSQEGKIISITPYHQGKKHGIAKVFLPEGSLFMTLGFANDLTHGEMLQYFPNGKIYKNCQFVNGNKEGEEKTYFINGKLAALVFLKNGKQDGLYQEWNQNGILIFEGEYKEGLRHGKFNKYYDDGKPKLLQVFVEDQLHGVKKAFDSKGNVQESQYEMGKKISR